MTFFQYFGRLHNKKVPALEACFPFHWATPPGYSRGELSCTNVGPMRVKRKLFKVHSFGKVRVRTSRRIFFFTVIKLLQWIFFKQSPQCGNWSLKSFFVLTKPDHPFLHFFSVYFIFPSFHLTDAGYLSPVLPKAIHPTVLSKHLFVISFLLFV